MYMKAALGADGNQRRGCNGGVPSDYSIFDVNCGLRRSSPSAAGLDATFLTICQNLRIENGPAKAHVRIGWLRSVANIYHALLFNASRMTYHVAGPRSVDYLLDLIGNPAPSISKGGENTEYGAPYDAYPLGNRPSTPCYGMSRKNPGGERQARQGTGRRDCGDRSVLDIRGHGR